ncbi:LacI family DNA-binding transcriptional regulator [Streptomyces synnematoformans]|uniref:LacI family DNA-binding transcriptional regulator n=1 Tax=Streptomyces synnematoformans TaxID=415721 RepID=A0ABN2XEV2_9ACTN
MPHGARPTITLQDVARRAGVSVATASRVLGGSARPVGQDYRERVLAAASELHYVPDAAARAMRRGSDAVCLLADDMTTPTIALLIAAMERAASAADAFVTVSSTGGSVAGQLRAIEVARAVRPRALVLTSGRIDAAALGGRLLDALRSYADDGGRVVVVGETDLPFPWIGFDNRGGARTLGRLVAEQGHRRVAVLGGPRGHFNADERVAGFLEGLADCPAPVTDVRVLPCELSRSGGHHAARSLLADGTVVDVIMAINDLIAIGALAALNAADVPVPEQMSVVGFDDIPLAADVTPRLTTLALPFQWVGAEAIRRALDTDGEEPEPLRVAGTLVVRQSLRLRDVG